MGAAKDEEALREELFLKENAKRKDVVTLKVGVQYKSLRTGLGLWKGKKTLTSHWHYLLTTLRLTPNATEALDEEWVTVYDTYKQGDPVAIKPLGAAESKPGLAAAMLQMVEGDIF